MFVPCVGLRPATVNTLAAQIYDGYYDVFFSFDNPFGQWTDKAYRNVQLNYEKARQMVLKDGYAALWCVENDMVVPPDALAKLDATDAPVVSGLYVLRHGANEPNVRRGGHSVTWNIVRECLRHNSNEIETDGGCQGCVLLRREALVDFNFLREHNAAPDIDLMRACAARGLKQIARLDVQCGHIENDGTILWPSQFLGG